MVDTKSQPKEEHGKPAFLLAFATAQASIEGAEKDGKNKHFGNEYTTLKSCWEACRAALTENGFSVIQGGKKIDEQWTLETKLCHSSGHEEVYHLPLLLGKNDMQGLGSAVTYARRYGLCAIVGVAPEDDDGEAAAKTGVAKIPQGISPERDGRDLQQQAIDLYRALQNAPSMQELDRLYNHGPNKKVMVKLTKEGETEKKQKIEDLFNTRSAVFQQSIDQASADVANLNATVN